MLKVLSEDFGQTVMFGVGPEVRVEPAHLIRNASPHCVPDNRFVWVKHRELFREFLRLSQSIRSLENDVAANKRVTAATNSMIA